VWRNDPDHIELSDREAWRSTMVTSLTGSLFLLTDKPERYLTPYVEPAKRAAPVLVTVPGQLYDVDPSRSDNLWQVDGEVSGRDPKPFDAGMAPAANLYQLDVVRPFEAWTVLGRTGGDIDEIPFDQLGLDPSKAITTKGTIRTRAHDDTKATTGGRPEAGPVTTAAGHLETRRGV
jgi:hypothetical protein